MSHTETLSTENFSQLGSIEEGYFWFEGRILWVKALLSRFCGIEQSQTFHFSDLGCGTGQIAKILNQEYPFKTVFLVDGHSHPIAPWKGTDVRIVRQDLEKEFQIEEKMDVVTCLDVIEHLENDLVFLKRVKKILSPNGKLIISVPAFSFLFSSWDQKWGHFRRYSIQDLRQKLQESDYEVEFASYAWSFLFPVALFRRWGETATQEFPQVSKVVNFLLVFACRVEVAVSRWIKLPFGTSVMLVARPLRTKI